MPDPFVMPADESRCVANENFGPDFSTYSPIWAWIVRRAIAWPAVGAKLPCASRA